MTNQPTNKEEVIVTQIAPVGLQEFLETGTKKGVLIYNDENGTQTSMGSVTKGGVHFAVFSPQTVFYVMDEPDAPWTSLCPLQSVIGFIEASS